MDRLTKKKLAIDSGLTEKQVFRWFSYEKNKNPALKSQLKLEQNVLNSFFENKSIYPTVFEMNVLATEINKDLKYVRDWFTQKRFLLKKSQAN